MSAEEQKAAETAAAIRVVKGEPSDEELAALVAVLSAGAASGSGTPESSRPRETWGAPETLHRPSYPFSPASFGHRG